MSIARLYRSALAAFFAGTAATIALAAPADETSERSVKPTLLAAAKLGIPAERSTPKRAVASRPAPADARPDQSTTQEVRERSADIPLIEQLVFDATNEERRRAGLQPFRPDAALAAAARRHSVDMATRNYFSHTTRGRGVFGVGGTGLDARLSAQGISPRRYAENIAMEPTVTEFQTRERYDDSGRRLGRAVVENRLNYRQLAAKTVQDWMESPGHRKNIMNPQLTSLGVGAGVGSRDGFGYVYLTQDFSGE